MKINSLKKNGGFRLVYSRGRSHANRLLVMYALKNKSGETRLGLSVSKKVGGAVVRNKVRRRLKEITRLFAKDGNRLKPGTDIVIIARQAAAGAAYSELCDAAIKLFQRHGLVNDEEGSACSDKLL